MKAYIVPVSDFGGRDSSAVLMGWRNEDRSTIVLYIDEDGTSVLMDFSVDVIPCSLGKKPFPDCCESENFTE